MIDSVGDNDVDILNPLLGWYSLDLKVEEEEEEEEEDDDEEEEEEEVEKKEEEDVEGKEEAKVANAGIALYTYVLLDPWFSLLFTSNEVDEPSVETLVLSKAGFEAESLLSERSLTVCAIAHIIVPPI